MSWQKIYIGFVFLTLSIGIMSAQRDRMSASSFGYAGVTVAKQAWDSVLYEGTTTNVLTYKTPLEKTLYITDNKGNIQTEETFEAGNKPPQSFQPQSKKLNTYNEKGQCETSETLLWDSVSGFYLEHLKSEFEYPSENSAFETKYKLVNDRWLPYDSVKIITAYNLNHDPVEEVYYSYNAVTWADSVKIIYTYDSQNRLTERFTFDLKRMMPENKERISITYDEDGKTAEIVLEYWDGRAWAKPVFKINGYDLVRKGKASYSMLACPIHLLADEKKDDVKTYPNPTNDGFYINAGNDIAVVAIYSLRGNLLHREQVSGTSYINTNDLGTGTFLVKITLKGKTVTKRLQIK